MLRRLTSRWPERIVPSMAAILLAAAPVGTVAAWAGDGPGNRATLKGISAVKVMVAPTSIEAEWDRVRSDDLESEVQRRLREAGITVMPSAGEVLSIDVEAKKAGNSPWFACSTRIELLQSVSLVRDPQFTVFAPTWGLDRVEDVSAYDLRRVRETVRELVDRFIHAYREQNPAR